MRAAFYERNGTARDVMRVGDVETPHATAGEVRVKLAVSGVNPSDVKSRQGLTRKIAWPRVIPQRERAGTIDEVGAGVPKSRLGERVWIWNGQWKRPFGTAAEYIALPSEQAVQLPDNMSFEAGACLGIPAMTAFHAVALVDLEPQSRVLISGGGGAVSQYAIQFAKKRGAAVVPGGGGGWSKSATQFKKTRGAAVITPIPPPEKGSAAREAGADHCID